jgi:aminopeptidase N
VPISILYPYGSKNKARFALNLAKKGLELFEGWFDSMYPLPKLDMVAVPDFCYGGGKFYCFPSRAFRKSLC